MELSWNNQGLFAWRKRLSRLCFLQCWDPGTWSVWDQDSASLHYLEVKTEDPLPQLSLLTCANSPSKSGTELRTLVSQVPSWCLRADDEGGSRLQLATLPWLTKIELLFHTAGNCSIFCLQNFCFCMDDLSWRKPHWKKEQMQVSAWRLVSEVVSGGGLIPQSSDFHLLIYSG